MMTRDVIRNPLLLPELFHHILDHVDEPSPVKREDRDLINHISPEARKTFFALARTCRATSESSLDRLWRVLDSLDPLHRFARNMSAFQYSSTEDEEREVTPPSPAQWAVIRRYASRVRELKIEINPYHSSFDVLQRFTGSQPLFPNLRVLSWYRRYGYLDCPFLLIKRLLVPGLVALEGSFIGNEGDPAEQFFEQYPLVCSNLKVLGWYCHRIPHALSDSIPRLTKVENLTLSSPLDPIPMKHVILSAQYKVLDIVLDHHSTQHTISPVDTPFPSVETIELKSDLGCLTGLLRPRQQIFRSVTFEHVLADSPPQYPARAILSFFTALATPQRINSLHTINVTHCYRYLSPEAAQALEGDPVAYLVTYETLSPLKSLRHLHTVHIELGNMISLDDDEFGALTCNWPSLEVLRLDCASKGSLKHVTLHGLLTLIVNCPQLRILRLPIDARVVPIDASPDIRNERITSVRFPDSPIREPALVAKFLRKHLPRVQHDESLLVWAYSHERKWKKVRELLSSS